MKQKNFYFYSNILAWGLILLLTANYVFGWTTPSSTPPAGNVTLSPGALPSSEPGYIQFASSSTAFGGDANLFWNNTTKRLGIATTTPAATLHVAGTGKFSGVLDMTTQKITALATPTADTDAATKGYVDSKTVCSFCVTWSTGNGACSCPGGFTLWSPGSKMWVGDCAALSTSYHALCCCLGSCTDAFCFTINRDTISCSCPTGYTVHSYSDYTWTDEDTTLSTGYARACCCYK